MKRIHATRVTIALIVGVLIWHYVERRHDLQCYVMQQASNLEFVFAAGYASEEEIRDIVWNDTKTDLYGQAWWASLDNVFHAIFMGGSRGQQVVAHLTNAPADSTDIICDGRIEWTIWWIYDSAEMAVYESYSGAEIKSLHHVTTALQAIPSEELHEYEVDAELTYFKSRWKNGNGDWSGFSRDGGTVSARDWLDGKVVPDYWSGWYVAWLEQGEELQDGDEE